MHVSLHLHSSALAAHAGERGSDARIQDPREDADGKHVPSTIAAEDLAAIKNLTVGQLLSMNGSKQSLLAETVLRLSSSSKARAPASADAREGSKAPARPTSAPTTADGMIQDSFLRMGGASPNGQAFNQYYTLCNSDTSAFVCLLKHLFQIMMGVVAFAAFLSAFYWAWTWLG